MNETAQPARRWNITVRDTGKSFPCAEDQAVFRELVRAKAGIKNYGCCGGGCGICKMKVASGEWRPFKNMSEAHVSEADKQAGVVLMCCVQPRSDMVIAYV